MCFATRQKKMTRECEAPRRGCEEYLTRRMALSCKAQLAFCMPIRITCALAASSLNEQSLIPADVVGNALRTFPGPGLSNTHWPALPSARAGRCGCRQGDRPCQSAPDRSPRIQRWSADQDSERHPNDSNKPLRLPGLEAHSTLVCIAWMLLPDHARERERIAIRQIQLEGAEASDRRITEYALPIVSRDSSFYE